MGGPGEQTVNNPVAIADRDGTTHFVYCVEYMRAFYMRSADDGAEWSAPVEITPAFEPFRAVCHWQALATGPGHGIQLRGGRLLIPVWMADYTPGAQVPRACAVILSDDEGKTWQAGGVAIADAGATECAIEEIAEGRVILSARNADPRNRRAIAFSEDGGLTWAPHEFADDLPEPGCMAALLRHPGDAQTHQPVLLFANPDTTDREHRSRRDLALRASLDGGRSWPVRRLLQPGPAAYSDLAVLPDGTILCFYESGRPGACEKHGRPWAYACLTMARFDLAWLMSAPRAEPMQS